MIGNLMYPATVFLRILALVRSGLLNLTAIKIQSFKLADLPAGMGASVSVIGTNQA
jgi:hypothetical protein